MRKMRNISLLAVILVLGVACGEKEPDPVKPVSLSAPAGVKLNRQTDHSLIFQWDAVENAEVYSWKLLQGSAEVQTGQTRNTNAIIDALVKAKPAAAKGIYLRRIAVSSTMGAGVRVEPGSLKGILDDRTIAPMQFYSENYEAQTQPDGSVVLMGRGVPLGEDASAPEGSDVKAVLDGYIAVGKVKSAVM